MTANKRKSISKKIRFEIFSRDNFTCQYCGQKAPSVILEIDHILPVSKGGKNDILNLVTSCFDCNRGKSKKKLKEIPTIEKQMNELSLLNKKNEQLKFIAKWQKELNNLENNQIEIFKNKFYNETCEYISLTQIGKKKILLGIKDFGIELLLECIEISASKYNGAENIFNKTFGIAKNKTNPISGKINLLKNLSLSKFKYFDSVCFHILVKKNIEHFGESIIDLFLKEFDTYKNWNDLRNRLEEQLNDE